MPPTTIAVAVHKPNGRAKSDIRSPPVGQGSINVVWEQSKCAGGRCQAKAAPGARRVLGDHHCPQARLQLARALGLNLERSLGSLWFDETRLGPASDLVPKWVDDVLAGSS
jgi:hypothetical protein